MHLPYPSCRRMLVSRECGTHRLVWIPAYAGMTMVAWFMPYGLCQRKVIVCWGSSIIKLSPCCCGYSLFWQRGHCPMKLEFDPAPRNDICFINMYSMHGVIEVLPGNRLLQIYVLRRMVTMCRVTNDSRMRLKRCWGDGSRRGSLVVQGDRWKVKLWSVPYFLYVDD